MASGCWYSLPCRIAELRLDITLACGQSFRWKEIQQGVWRSVLHGKIWTLKQTDSEILYQVHENKSQVPSTAIKSEPNVCTAPSTKAKSTGTKCNTSIVPILKKEVTGATSGIKSEEDHTYRDVLTDYLQLEVSLQSLYKQWQDADANFNHVAADFPGVRMLRQDPTENLFAFICSSNNNISRITSMVEKLCLHYGDKVATIDGEDWYGFPPAAALASDSVEQKLRDLGFGYRAKFINQTAKFISQKEDGWLESLRLASYEEAHSELLQLTGVGAKVADCVCLMSLDKTGAIPVDTHVWQIAARDYMPKLAKTKSLTDKIYREIGDHFRGLFGEYAGWAHSVLFSADLKKFKKDNTPKKKGKVAIKHESAGDADIGSCEPKKAKKTRRTRKK
ncbi:N-glycosylase/DNA lyase-like [Amphiura filiformis]|uniref:N-glycosylase/DNA lyase-like n=1 Tax=Amphiura filiformis TaxID=82378 RepID=UPI003B220DBF